jgi:hypothetical protein
VHKTTLTSGESGIAEAATTTVSASARSNASIPAGTAVLFNCSLALGCGPRL